jgi:hypothetical protein
MRSCFTISHEVEAVQIPRWMELFASAWWAVGRTQGDDRRMLAGPDVIVMVVHRTSARLIGFARVLTDAV